MKKIIKIARLELNILFYSPIAWLVLIIFIVQCGITFTGLLYDKETSQQMGNTFEFLSRNLFSGSDGFFTAVQKKLYLYIPLLTMGLMSREISSGSIKLLLSSPLTSTQIILGKFVSMMGYGAILMLVLCGIMLSGVVAVEALDVQYVLGGMLGLYLLICAYAAIGLYMSSLTAYQVVAAISTLAVLAALNFVNKVGQGTDFIRDITYWLSIAGRADNFINGLITSSDVIYFLLVIMLFLSLSIMKLNAGREIRSQATAALRYSLLVGAVILLGVVSSMPQFTAYYDTTRFKTNTLTESSKEIIRQLQKPVKITTYANVVDNAFGRMGAPKWRKFEIKQFEQYTRYLPGIEFEYVAFYDTLVNDVPQNKPLEDRAMRAATANGFDFTELLTPKEIKKVINLIPEENRFTRTISYDGKETFLRMYFDMIYYPQEAEISAALKRLLIGTPVIGILSGNEERSINKTGDKAYKSLLNTLTVRNSMINQGFDVKAIELNDTTNIPSGLTVLIVADPRTQYTETQISKISDYISKGGNLMISTEPGRQNGIEKIISPLGVKVASDTLRIPNKDLEPELMITTFGPLAAKIGFSYPKETLITLPTASEISYAAIPGYQYTPLLFTKMQQPVALAITRKLGEKEQRILISGDADFMSNAELSRYNVKAYNTTFATNLFRWFTNGQFPVDTTRPKSIDNKIQVTREQIGWMKIILLGIIPGLLLLAGAYSLISRKRN
ncbi:Gldg family protein [Pedobacter faecalis]|uniref:Gldg family protein n=1 Tax=Pedobacter faecalis TaxID=3041495 RepID=UPI00254A18BD|nr:Gldg family protein [Pedobacter sp. ELA7]